MINLRSRLLATLSKLHICWLASFATCKREVKKQGPKKNSKACAWRAMNFYIKCSCYCKPDRLEQTTY
jgi:hypothetical protein